MVGSGKSGTPCERMHPENFTAIASTDAEAAGLEQPEGEQPELDEALGDAAPARRQSRSKGDESGEQHGGPPTKRPAPQRQGRLPICVWMTKLHADKHTSSLDRLSTDICA